MSDRQNLNRKQADLFTRQLSGDWLLHTIKGDSGVIRIDAIKVDLHLDDLYANVEFPPPSAPFQAS